MKFLLSLFLFITWSFQSSSQTKTYIASRITVPPKIDGLLNDSCWVNVAVAKDFLTNEPVFGNPATQKTEVKFVYDDDAVYLAYFLFDTDASKIIKVLSERDKNIIADEIMVGIDPYNEKTSAFRFQVTAGGVQTDRIMSPFILSSDRSWDAVWESAVRQDENGWYLEIKIPLSALRFPKKPVQEWTIQFGRYVGRSGEFTTWSPVNPNIGGGPIRQWGLMKGIENIKPKIRLSFWPYFTTGIQKIPLTASTTAFSTKPFYAGGMDLKYGINQSYTLDMALVPDFSQVQSDNTVLNLTPFEIRYDERRQFFTEGTDMFNKAGIFYSRRIGNTPSGFSSLSGKLQHNERIIENPSVTGLINATKVSGRNNKGLGIGVLNAVTQNMYAKVQNDSSGNSRKILTEPFTNYNVLVIDQSLKRNSKIGFINTNVLRTGHAVNANVSAIDFILNSKGNIYALTGTGIYSYRSGLSLAGGKQTGYNYRIDFAKVSRNFRFEIFNKSVHKNYNPNDLGLFGQTNFMQNFLAVKYYSFKPEGNVLNWNSVLSYTLTNTLENLSFQRADVDWSAFFLLRSFATYSFAFTWNPERINDIYESRSAGKYFIRPKAFRTAFVASTDTRKKAQLQFSGSLKWFEFPGNHFYYDAGIAPVIRIGQKAIISLNSYFSDHNNNQGYVSTINPDSIIFGLRKEQSVENIIVLQYLFSPYSNLSFRVRDYWSKVRYNQFYRLQNDGNLKPLIYTKNADINLNLFNIDMIYTWQYAPGSFLSVSWKNNIGIDTKNKEDGYFKNLSDVLDAPQSNSVSVRMIYYLEYLKLRKMFTHHQK